VLPREGDSPIAAYADDPGRVARALCDREDVCGRIGKRRVWDTDLACMDAMSARAGTELGQMACRFDPNALATCIAAVRAVRCTEALDRLAAIDVCMPPSICAAR
jgi:hypothetical protein